MVQFSHRSHLFTINLNVSHVVLEDSGDVDLRELVLAEHDQQAGLAAGSISYDHQPDPTKVLLYTGGGGHVLNLYRIFLSEVWKEETGEGSNQHLENINVSVLGRKCL